MDYFPHLYNYIPKKGECTMLFNILPENFAHLPFYFYSLSFHYEQNNIFRPSGYEMDQILLVLDGTGILTCDGKTYSLKKGCGFFLAKNFPHEYINTGNLITAWVSFNGTALQTIFNYYHANSFLFCENVQITEILNLMKQMNKEYYFKKRESILSFLLYQIIILFFDSTKNYNISPMQKVELYIEQNFKNKITLDELVSVSGFSKSKFCLEFKEHFGCTAFEKILNLRLSYANQLLNFNSKYKIKDVAAQCGFEDISYFCSSYKKKYGISPKQSHM